MASWQRHPKEYLRCAVALSAALVPSLAVPGCFVGHRHLRHTLITAVCVSPAGRQVAFNLTRPNHPTTVYVLRLADTDGKLARTFQKAGSVEVVGWCDDKELYLLDNHRILRYEMASGKRASVSVHLPPAGGRERRIIHAAYVASLDLFVILARIGDSGDAIYAASPRSGKAETIARGRLVVHASGVVEHKRMISMIASERGTSPELPSAAAFRLYRYPPAVPPVTFSLPICRGAAGLGDITPDGATAVLPYREYPWKPPRCYLYVVDLLGRRVRHKAALNGGVSVIRTGDANGFLVVGPDTFATFSIRNFQLKPMPGGPIGTPSSMAVTADMRAVIATTELELYVVDIKTGKRRLLWRAPGGDSRKTSPSQGPH